MFFWKWDLLLTVVGYSSRSYSTDIAYWEIPQKNSEDIEEKKSYDISQKDSQRQNIHSVFIFSLLTIPESHLWEILTAIYLFIDIHIYKTWPLPKHLVGFTFKKI